MAVWKKMRRAWTSSEGSSGVVFVSFLSESQGQEGQENVQVIKSSSRIAEEFYANR